MQVLHCLDLSLRPLRIAATAILAMALCTDAFAQHCGGKSSGYPIDELISSRESQLIKTDRSDKELATLRAWNEVNRKIGRVVGKTMPLIICFDPAANAHAISSEKIQLIGVTVGMLELLGDSQELIAHLLGHEYAHLTRHHAQQKMARSAIADEIAKNVYARVLSSDRYWGYDEQNWLEAISAASSARDAYFFGYSREYEKEADKWGVMFARKSGYDPLGYIHIVERMLANKVGEALTTDFRSSHPGWIERKAATSSTVADEIMAGQYEVLRTDASKKERAGFLKQWIALLPNGGQGWYYKAILLQGTASASESMELAFTGRNPELKLEKDALAEAKLWLCVEIYKLGPTHWSEGVRCASIFFNKDKDLWDRFYSQTPGGWILAGDAMKYEIATLRKGVNGVKLITNDHGLAKFWLGHVDPVLVTDWKPVRWPSCGTYGRCDEVGRHRIEHDLRVRAINDDPFAEVRDLCKPPECQQVFAY